MSGYARIGGLCEQIRGVSYSKSDAILEPRIGFSPILRANNISERGLTYESLVFVPDNKIKDKQRIRKGDVVIAASSGSIDVVGKAAVARNNFDGAFGAFCKVLRPNSTVDPGYFAHYFQTKKYRSVISSLAAGANINNLKNEHLNDLDIRLPPLLEQRRIAAILDKADELRQKRRQAIEKLDQLLQSVFLHMFGDPVKNPRGWELLPLGGLLGSKASNGAYFPQEAYVVDTGVEMVHMSDAFYGKVEPGKLKRVSASAREVQKYGLSESDLLISRRSLVYEGAAKPCKIGKLSESMIFESSLIKISPDLRRLTTNYLYHYLANARARQKYLVPYITKSTISGINQSNLMKVCVLVPDIKLQVAFDETCLKLESEIEKQVLQQRAMQQLFLSLQQRAFNGTL